MAKNRKTISFTVEDFEHDDVSFCAQITGHGGKSPASSFAHFATMKEVRRIKATDDGQSHRPGKGYVYIVKADVGGYVKIGFSETKGAKSRIKQIQQNLPFTLLPISIISDCTYEDEKRLHKKYQKHRIRGEWFSEDVLQEIQEDFVNKPLKNFIGRLSSGSGQ